MSFHNLLMTTQVDLACDPAAAGTTAVNGKTIDCAGFESILFAVSLGAIVTGAVTAIKIQGGNASDASDMADVAGASVSVSDSKSNTVVLSAEIHRPTVRYLRVVVTRSTQNATVNAGFVIKGRVGFLPPALGANVGNAALPPVLVSVP